jgi:ABC-type multidrug transport system fused ATPase/permease subunit
MFFSAAIFKLSQDVLGFIQPQFLKMMMEFAKNISDPSGTPEPVSKGFLIAFAMLISAILQTTVLHQYFHICMVSGMRMRSAIITAVYRKALVLSNASRQGSTVGEIVNLMSVDASRLMDLFTYLHILWSGPFQIFLAIYFLYQALGVAIFGGVAVMILMIPVNAYLAARSRTLQKTQMINKDNRTRLMDELLNGIRVIKLYAWENAFLKKINNVREAELETLRKIGFLSAMQTFTWSATPFLVSFTSFAIFSFVSNESLTSTKSSFLAFNNSFRINRTV